MLGLRRLSVVAAGLLPLACDAHWRLTKPVPRSGGVYENDPLPPNANTQEEWVCRHAQPNPRVPRPTFAAGGTAGIVYGTGAIGHAGDCAVYLSYDLDRPRRSMRWVKIANLPDCRSQINQEVLIALPSQLPAGDAVLRWDQYALHQGTFVEWFIQCADVTISSASARSWESFNSFSMIDNDGTPAYPSDVGRYRSPYNPAQAAPGGAGFFMTGPACVDDSVNQCALTAVGTKGYTGFGGEDGAGSVGGAVEVPALPPAAAAGSSMQPPAPAASAPAAGDAMCCYDATCSTYGTSFCNALGSWCSASSENCEACGGTLCADPAGSYPAPAPAAPAPAPAAYPAPAPPATPAPAPPAGAPPATVPPYAEQPPEAPPSAAPPSEAPPSGAPAPPDASGVTQCCYYAGCAAYGSAQCNAAGAWCSASAEACSACGGTLCSGVSLLADGRAARQSLRRRPRRAGHVLMQARRALARRARAGGAAAEDVVRAEL